jgi:hypothetical protein
VSTFNVTPWKGDGTSTKQFERNEEMVEAPGVEPGSESTSPQDSTCVSPLEFSSSALERGENPLATSGGKSYDRGPRRPVIASLLNGILTGAVGVRRGTLAVN